LEDFSNITNVLDNTRNKIISLAEYEKTEALSLEDDTYIALMNNFSSYIDLINSNTPGDYFIKAKQFCGVIKTDNLIIEINPKIGLENLFYLINYCYDIPVQFTEHVPLLLSEEIFNYYVYLFAKAVKEIISKGIYKKYLDITDSTIYIKGRLLIEKNIRQQNGLQLKNICRFDEFSEDIPENQILKYILQKLIKIIEDKNINKLLRYCLVYLKDIRDLKIITGDDFNNIIFTRLNNNHRYPLKLAKLFLDNFFIKDAIGNSRVSSFLVDMNKLFEIFVFKALEERFEDSEYEVKYQRRHSLDDERIINIYPDIMVFKNNKPFSVIDTKYKLLKKGEYNISDIYQMITYCKKLNLSEGLIVLPYFYELNIYDNSLFSFFDGEIRLSNHYVDLSKENILNKTAINSINDYLKAV